MIAPITPSSPPAVRVLGPLPQTALGYMLRVMIQHFADPASVRDAALKNLQFTPDTVSGGGVVIAKSTSLRITTVGRFSPADADQQPALVLRHGGMTPGEHITIGDRLQGNSVLLGMFDPNEIPQMGDTVTARFYKSSVAIVATAPDYGAADALGAEAYQEVIAWQPLIASDWRAYDVRDVAMGEVSRLEGAAKAWAVEINLPYTFLMLSILRPQSPLLKRVTVSSQ